MIGNDLVAFKACRQYSSSRWQAYWGKILQEEERDHFHFQANDPFAWIYWAAKEAAWKIWYRRSAKRLLNPKAFVVQNIIWEGTQANFEVSGPDQNYIGFAELNESYLHAILRVKAKFEVPNGPIYSSKVCAKGLLMTELNAEQSLQAYFPLFKDDLARTAVDTFDPKPQFSLSRNNLGIPALEIAGNVLDLPISLSHHGSWAAYAYVYPQRTQP